MNLATRAKIEWFKSAKIQQIRRVQIEGGKQSRNKKQSEISPSFADRFLREFVL